MVIEAANEGLDTVRSSVTYSLGANVENLTLTGNASITGTGNARDNVLTGNTAGNVLIGGDGNDTYVVKAGDTVIEHANEGTDTVQSSVTFALSANVENLVLTGNGAIDGAGNDLANLVQGNPGANVLDGGTAADTLIGGKGNDTYLVEDLGDLVIEQANEGTDTVQSSVNWTLGDNLENLMLIGSAAINGTGNSLNNVLTGNGATNVLAGGLGNDTYIVGDGDTVLENANEGTDTVQSAVNWTLGDNLENLTLIGNTAINGTGNVLNNVLTGNSAANMLTGGPGNDTYVVGEGDMVIENANDGTDAVQSAVNWTLGENLENLTLAGTAAINGTGNALNNVLTGNSAANVLTGGAGDDTYVAGDGDTVVEQANEGIDTVKSAVSWTVSPNVENLTLTGSDAVNGTGNNLNNVLTGNGAANVLAGGTGDDTYVVGLGDTVVEQANEGLDTVKSAISWALSHNVENLTLTGSDAVNATGNNLNNVLTGNNAANVLAGGVGDDTYVVGAGDTVIENLNEGLDTVQSSVDFALGDNLENLTLTGSTAINASGNALDNLLTGNSAANVLIGGGGNDTINGGAGADTLVGGTGNDTYIVANAGDIVTENANEGTDVVQGSISYTLGANVENLTLTGSGGLTGTGNAQDNHLTGNAGANTIDGGAGNDTLIGALGNDTLKGGTGNDTYVVTLGDGQDKISENDATPRNADTLLYGIGINPLDLVLSRQVNDLRLSVHGTTDQVTIQNWYSGAANQVETIHAGNGQHLLNNQVQQLIQAMATFTSQNGLTWDQAIAQRPQDVQTILAANWQN